MHQETQQNLDFFHFQRLKETYLNLGTDTHEDPWPLWASSPPLTESAFPDAVWTGLKSHQSQQSVLGAISHISLCIDAAEEGAREAPDTQSPQHRLTPSCTWCCQILQWRHSTTPGYSEIRGALKGSINSASNFLVLVQNPIKPKIYPICIKKSCLPQRPHAQPIWICRHNFV